MSPIIQQILIVDRFSYPNKHFNFDYTSSIVFYHFLKLSFLIRIYYPSLPDESTPLLMALLYTTNTDNTQTTVISHIVLRLVLVCSTPLFSSMTSSLSGCCSPNHRCSQGFEPGILKNHRTHWKS